MGEEAEVERRFLGMVEVDSGTLLIGDPTYCLPQAEGGKSGIDYQSVIDAPLSTASYLGDQPVLLVGNFGGDGTFPVFAELDEYGGLVRVTVEFVDPEDDDETDESTPE